MSGRTARLRVVSVADATASAPYYRLAMFGCRHVRFQVAVELSAGTYLRFRLITASTYVDLDVKRVYGGLVGSSSLSTASVIVSPATGVLPGWMGTIDVFTFGGFVRMLVRGVTNHGANTDATDDYSVLVSTTATAPERLELVPSSGVLRRCEVVATYYHAHLNTALSHVEPGQGRWGAVVGGRNWTTYDASTAFTRASPFNIPFGELGRRADVYLGVVLDLAAPGTVSIGLADAQGTALSMNHHVVNAGGISSINATTLGLWPIGTSPVVTGMIIFSFWRFAGRTFMSRRSNFQAFALASNTLEEVAGAERSASPTSPTQFIVTDATGSFREMRVHVIHWY